MSIPPALLDYLKANTIPYEILPHAKTFTAGMAAAAEHIAPPSASKGRYGKLKKRCCHGCAPGRS
jgi:hypothetical protein